MTLYPLNLFLLYVEALSTMIVKGEVDGLLKGIKVIRRSPSITHLMFVDDCFIFSSSETNETRVISSMLLKYQRTSR